MTIYIDKRKGSVALASYIQPRSLAKLGQFDADIEFMGYLPSGPAPIGIEYKSAITGDIFDSLTDGRLTGTQIPRMLGSYSVRYILIEGPTRVTPEGILEVSPMPGQWRQVFGRRGEGWTAREYWNRLERIADCGFRVKETHNIQQSAAWITSIYHGWSRPYDEHRSHLAWDQSGTELVNHALIQTSKLPLVMRWARELPSVGQDKAAYLANHFGSGAAMVLADENEWRKVKWKVKSGKLHGFGKAMIAKIMNEIWGVKGE